MIKLKLLLIEKLKALNSWIATSPSSPAGDGLINNYCSSFSPEIICFTYHMKGDYYSQHFSTNLVILDQKLASQEQF